MAQSKLVLGYWGIKGRAQAVRNFLEYLELPYENKLYTDPAEWYGKDRVEQEKTHAFINLPYIADGDKVINETDALFHYAAVKAGKVELVAPSDGGDLVLLAVLRGVLTDLLGDMIKASTAADAAAGMEVFQKTAVPRLARLSKHLGKNNYFVNNKITYLDFVYYELFSAIKRQEASLLPENLGHFVANFETIPQIKAYLSSDRNLKIPFLTPGKFVLFNN